MCAWTGPVEKKTKQTHYVMTMSAFVAGVEGYDAVSMVTEVSCQVSLSHKILTGDWRQLGDGTADVRELYVDDMNSIRSLSKDLHGKYITKMGDSFYSMGRLRDKGKRIWRSYANRLCLSNG